MASISKVVIVGVPQVVTITGILIEIEGHGCFAKPSLGNFMATFMDNYHLPLKVFFSHHLLS
jgi:hypothetical protein